MKGTCSAGGNDEANRGDAVVYPLFENERMGSRLEGRARLRRDQTGGSREGPYDD